MAELFTVENLFTLAMLVLLQAVLGFDNLLYISIESKRVEASQQAFVRKVGILLAIGLRIVLLFAVTRAIKRFQDPFFEPHTVLPPLTGILEASFNVHSIIVLLGGAFIIYTAVKEIHHMLSLHDIDGGSSGPKRSVFKAVTWIVLMNLVFSFDSILSAIALSDSFAVMATAIVISGAMMIWLADTVSEFLQRNRMYEVLGLFILFIVGVMLVSEGGHLAELKLFKYPVEAMEKTTFYFVILVLVVVDIVQGRYQSKLLAQQKAAQSGNTA